MNGFTPDELEYRRNRTYDMVELDDILGDAIAALRAATLRIQDLEAAQRRPRFRSNRPHLVLVTNAPDRLDPGPAPTHGGSRESCA